MTENDLENRHLMVQKIEDQDLVEAEQLVEAYLDLATKHEKKSVRSHINHHGYTLMGLIKLQHGLVEEAKDLLIKSAQVSYSPAISTFGPSMRLAKALLEIEEKNIVLNYLDECKQFWYFFLRFVQLAKWKKAIKNGEMPDFKGNLFY